MIEKVTAGRDAMGVFAPKFAELNDDVLFGQVWAREEQLSARDRSITSPATAIKPSLSTYSTTSAATQRYRVIRQSTTAPSVSLSATGSSKMPNSVIWLKRRAILPSNKSVKPDIPSTTAARKNSGGVSALKYRYTNKGISRMRK